MLILSSYYPCLPRMTLHLVSVSLFGLFCFKSTGPNLVKFYILPRWTKVVMYLNSLVTPYHLLGSSDLHVIMVCLSWNLVPTIDQAWVKKKQKQEQKLVIHIANQLFEEAYTPFHISYGKIIYSTTNSLFPPNISPTVLCPHFCI